MQRHILMPLLALILTALVPLGVSQAGSVQPLPSVTDADGRLGLNDVLAGGPGATSWAQLAYNAGARVNRWEFRWDRLEAQPGVWSFTSDDAAVNDAVASGLGVEGILIGTPSWATDGKPGNGVPRGLDLPIDDPRNLWAAYVRGTVAHFGGRVQEWEVWNEPDLGFFWSGTADQYFRLLKVAYLVVHATDPTARVLMGGMVVPSLKFPARVMDDAGNDPNGDAHNGYFDILAWHAYGPARELYSNLQRLRALLAAKGFVGTPIWVTEDGFPASNPNGEPRQAAYVIQSIAYALAGGASEVIVYRASDDTTGKQWGLLDATGQPRLGYVAFQLAARYFSGASSVVYAPLPGLERFAFYAPSRRVLLEWTSDLSDRRTVADAADSGGQQVDWTGQTAPIGPTVVLPGAGYNQGIDNGSAVVGGPPVLMVDTEAIPSGVSPQAVVPPLHGAGRRLILVNGGTAARTIVVAAARNEVERVVLTIPPGAAKVVDLDLLAGTSYRGMYMLQATGPVISGASEAARPVDPISLSSDWYLPVDRPHLTLYNPATTATSADVVGFGPNGRRVVDVHVVLPAGRAVVWQGAHGGRALSLVVHAAAPVIVRSYGGVGQSVSQKVWTIVHPARRPVAIFNPGTVPIHVNAGYVGARVVQGQQVAVAPHHTYVLSTHRSQAVILDADAPVVAAYANRTPLTAATPSTATSLTLAGSARTISVLNPSAGPAHLTASVLGSGQQIAVVVPPGHVMRLPHLSGATGPVGVVITSDVPIVASAG